MPTKSKKIKVVDNVPHTTFARRSCPMPMTKKFIDVEEGVKKDKEVKEKDVFDYSAKLRQNQIKRKEQKSKKKS
jgi:hypothetical protein